MAQQTAFELIFTVNQLETIKLISVFFITNKSFKISVFVGLGVLGHMSGWYPKGN